MKYLKNHTLKILFGILFVGASVTGFAQDRGKAVQAFNKALEYAKAEKYQEAINMYNQAIAQAEPLGDKGKDIVERCEKQLPAMYYQIALNSYKQFQKDKSIKSLDSTIDSFKEAGQMADEYKDKQISQKTEQVVTQLLYTKSILQFKSEDLNGAMASLDKAIQRNPNYAKAYYQKGLVVKKQKGSSLDDILNWFNKAVQVGEKVNDKQIVRHAREAARDELIYRGAEDTQNKKYKQAIDLLQRALTYDDSSVIAHYRLAEAYNKLAEWDKAIEHAKIAIKNDNRGKTDKAKIYYELGTAYKNKGDQNEACKAFANAAYGSFKASAEHQIEFELKCKGS